MSMMSAPEDTMKTRFIPLTCLLLLAVPAWGQSAAAPSGDMQRPLNLSLPRDVLSQPSGMLRNDADETAARNLRKEDESNAQRPPRYGTGFEARQRGLAGDGTASGMGGGMGTPMGGAGMGGGGRGGMGRGR